MDSPTVYNCEASNISLLLHNLEHCERQDKIKILQNIGLILASKDSTKAEFRKQGGNDIIMKYLQDYDWKISGTTFHILEKSMCQSLENKLLLTTKHMFQQLLQVLKHGTVNHKKSCMYFIASVVNGNVLGQTLVRETGCLDYLLHLCHETMQTTSPLKEDYWQFLCAAIKMCVNNPQNFTNQYQTSLVIPKAITFLENWFHQAFNKRFSEYVNMLTGMLVSIIAGNPTNQLCFSIYSGIQTVVRGLSLLIEWSDAPLNISDVLEKLVILLDAALHDNYENCEQAALQGAIPLMLKMLPTFKEQQKFSLLMALTHLIGASSNGKKEFIKENGITIVVVATVNCKKDSRIGDAANMLIKLCADTALQQNEQKEDAKILAFELVNKQNNSKKPKSNENNTDTNDHFTKQLDMSKVSNKQAQTDDIVTACSCYFPSRNQDKIHYHKLVQDSNSIFTVTKDKSYCTPLQDVSKTVGNLNSSDGVPERTNILNTPYKTTADSQAEENIMNNSGLNSSLLQRHIKYLFPETTCESSHILEKRSENLMHKESLCKTANNNIKTKTFQNRNKNIYNLMPTVEHNPKFLLQINKNPSVFEHYAVSYSPERNINTYIRTLPCQENNLQSDKQLRFVSEKTETLCSTNDCCKYSQNGTVCQSNVQVNVPAPTKEHQITFEKMAMSHDNALTKEHSVPQLFRNPDFQTNATLQMNTQQLRSKPKDTFCKVSSKVTTFYDIDGNPEFHIKSKNQNVYPGISDNSYSEQHFDLRHQKGTPNIRKGFHNEAPNQNSYGRTSQFSHSKQHLENSNSEINMQKDTSDTNEESHHKNANQNIHPRTSQFPNSERVHSIHSERNKQNNTSSTREQYHYEIINKNMQLLTPQFSNVEPHPGRSPSETNEQINSISTNGDNHCRTANKNILPRISQFSHSKQYKGGINCEINKQSDTSSTNQGSYKKANQSIHPRTSRLQYCKLVQNTNSKSTNQNSTSNTKEEPCNKNQNQSVHPRTSQFPISEHIYSTNSEVNEQNSTSRYGERSDYESVKKNIQAVTPQFSHFEQNLESTHSETNKQMSSIRINEGCHNRTANQNINPIKSQFSDPKRHLESTNSQTNMQRNTIITREVYHNEKIQAATLQCPHFQQNVNSQSQISQNNILKDISAHNSNASVKKTINHNMTVSPIDDKSEMHSNFKNSQYYYKIKNKTENGNNRFVTCGNFKMSKHQITCSGDGTTRNGTEAGYLTPSPNTHKNTDKINIFYPHLNTTQKRIKTSQSFDSIQNSQPSLSTFSSFTVQNSVAVTKKSDNSDKTGCSTGNVENVDIFQWNKMFNSTFNLEDTHAMTEKNINESDVRSNENKTNRVPTWSTLHCQQRSIEQKANKEVPVVREIKYVHNNNNSSKVSLSSSFSLKDKMFHKKQVSSPRYTSFKKPMLKYTKMELDNLVAGVAKYGLDFKAIRRAYTFHRKRTSKDLYLKWRNSFIHSRRYHVPVPCPQVQDSDQSTATGLHKFE